MSFFTLAYLARLEVWGLLVAAFQGGLVWVSWLAWERTMARAAATTRHRMACLHLAALVVLPALTVALLHWTVVGMGVPAKPGSPIAELPSLMAGYRDGLRFCLLPTVLWLTGACLMFLQLLADAHRLARIQREPAPAILVEAVRRLARDRLGMAVPTVLAAYIPSPRVVGWRRPVLLVPPDMAACLSRDEQEAVLLHELAHAHRGDFGWNLLQRLVLVLLWFQPAAWSLYRRVAREREVCCDALATRHGASATSLAKALVRLAENRTRPGLGMTIASHGELTARVHRLLGLHPAGSPSLRQRAAAVAMSLPCLVALGSGRLARADPTMAEICNASVFGPTIAIDAHDDAGSFALKVKRGRVIGATVGRQPLPRDHIVQHGDRVTLMNALREPIVALIVTPQGRIEWTARR